MPGVTTAYQTGVHASRPANGAGCILYSCTTHSLVYRDDGTSWVTWATLGTSGALIDPMTTRGDIIVRNASNATARLAIGAAGKLLSSDGTDVSWGNGPMTTKGDLIVGGTSGAPARLGVGSDTQVLTADSASTNGVKWAAASGGSSNPQQNYFASAAPGSPSAVNAEFDTPGGTPPGTRLNSGSAKGTWAVRDGGLVWSFSASVTGAELDVYAQSATIAAGDYIQMAYVLPIWNAAYVHPLIGFADGNTYGAGKQIITTSHWTGSTHRHMLNAFTNYNTRGTDGTIYDAINIGGAPVYTRLKYESANTFGLYVSVDGVNWHRVQNNYSLTMTPSYVIYGAGMFNSPAYSAADGTGFKIEYFRMNAT